MAIGFPLPQTLTRPVLGFRGGDAYGFGGVASPAGGMLSRFSVSRIAGLRSDAASQAAYNAQAATWLPMVQAAAGRVTSQGLITLQGFAAAVAALSGQAWGYLGRPRSTDIGFKPPLALPSQTFKGTYSKTGQTLIECVYKLNYGPGADYTYNFSWTKSNVKGAYFWGQYGTAAAPVYARLSFITISGGEFEDPGIYGGGYSNPADPWTASSAFTFTALDGEATPIEGPWGTGSNLIALPYAATSLSKVGTENPLPSAPAPLPAYLPAVTPGLVPGAVPVEVPGTEPNPDTGQPGRPVIAPPATPVIAPSAVPISPVRVPALPSGLQNNGQQWPVPLPKPAVTPVDNHYVNGQPITSGQPRTDIESIAKEVGRIENKTALALQNLAGPVGALDKLNDLASLVQLLWELLDATTSPGEYAISSPCVLDANGDRIETTVPYGGGPIIGRVESKVDALAALLQVHKDLKQPICDPGGIPRPNVTVTFTEV